jgi:uncharacterized membrane protein
MQIKVMAVRAWVGAGFFFVASAAMAQSVAGLPAGYDPGGLGDYMNILIQPRHAKLGLAGREGNWPLTAYAFKELHQSLNNTAKSIPKFRTLSVPDMFDATLGEPRKALEEAIKAKDSAKFNAAYGQLTAGCNACHTAAGMGFIVIKVPESPAFPNQDFSPKR